MNKIIDAEFLELQNNRAQIGAKNLRIGVLLHLVLEGLLGVESEALTGLCTTGTTGSLLRTSLRNGRDEQRLDADTRVVDLLLGEARVDHKHDTVDGQRGFSDVGGDHDLPAEEMLRSKDRKMKQKGGK